MEWVSMPMFLWWGSWLFTCLLNHLAIQKQRHWFQEDFLLLGKKDLVLKERQCSSNKGLLSRRKSSSKNGFPWTELVSPLFFPFVFLLKGLTWVIKEQSYRAYSLLLPTQDHTCRRSSLHMCRVHMGNSNGLK